MDKEDIRLSDFQRILFGEAPPAFLLEVLLRTLLVYMALLFAIRILGKRTNGELTITEVAVVIMLGAIVSVPMQQPDKGLLQGLLVLFCVVVFQRGFTWLTIKSRRVEEISQGTMSLLVKDGVIQLHELRKARITHQQLFTIIRSKKVYNLGKVKRLYLESCGTTSLYSSKENIAGLPVFPPDDKAILESQQMADTGTRACTNCGTVIQTSGNQPCPECKATEWAAAII